MGEIESLLLYALSVMLLFSLVGLMIGQRKGRAAAGFFFGALTGPIGWLVILIGPDYSDGAKKKVCRFCAETINDAAIVCKHCGRDQQTQSRPTLPPAAASATVGAPRVGHPRGASATGGVPPVRRSGASGTGDDFDDWLREQKEKGRL